MFNYINYLYMWMIPSVADLMNLTCLQNNLTYTVSGQSTNISACPNAGYVILTSTVLVAWQSRGPYAKTSIQCCALGSLPSDPSTCTDVIGVRLLPGREGAKFHRSRDPLRLILYRLLNQDLLDCRNKFSNIIQIEMLLF